MPLTGILGSGLNQAKLPLPTPATDETFVRRAYLDTIGLLPTPEELDSFLTSDSKTKHQELVDQLLESRYFLRRSLDDFLE